MTNWQTTKASDFCLSVRDGTHDSPKRVNNGKHLITSRHIIGKKIDLTNAYQISNSDYDEVNRRSKVDRWDVLFSMIGTVGEVCLVKDEPNFAIKNIGLFKSKNELSGKWLYYFLQSKKVKQVLNSLKRGTTQEYITLGDLRNLNISYPTNILETQRIISILSALDDKIENNRKMNGTLETVAQVLFKSWFVDFDPVHSKIDGNEPAHMDTKTADLFPTSFDDNGLPQGWKLLDIGSVVEVQKGLSYKGEFLSDTGAKMINLGCFGFRGTFKDEKIKNYVGDYKDRHKIKAGDLIFANTDMTQDRTILCSPVIVPNYIKGIETIFSHHVSHVNIIKSQHPVFLAFLRQFMMTPDFRFRAEGYATGTTVLAVPKNIFDGYYIPIPSNEILDVFYKFISNISKKIETNYIENKTLTKLRDILLPKLLSGEIRVKDAEREVEAAV